MGVKIAPLDMETVTVTPQAPRPSRSMKPYLVAIGNRFKSINAVGFRWCCFLTIWTVLGILLIASLFATFLYDFYIPAYEVQNFHIVGVKQPSAIRHSTFVVQMIFEIVVLNANKYADFYCSALDVQVQKDDLVIGSGVYPGFHQGHKTKVIPAFFEMAVPVSEDAVSTQNGVDLSDLELAIKLDTNCRCKLKFPFMDLGTLISPRIWMDTNCRALLNTTVSDGALVVLKDLGCEATATYG